MKKIFSIIIQDLINSSRNNILLFSITGPIICSVLVRLFFISSENTKLYFSAGPDIPTNIIYRISNFGNVEQRPSIEDVIDRVMEIGNTTGILFSDSTYKIIFEGNEPENFKRSVYYAISSCVDSNSSIIFQESTLSKNKFNNKILLTSIFFYAGFFLSGIVVGFIMVEDKESLVINAFNVTTVNEIDYLLGRSFTSGIFIFLICFTCTIVIYGLEMNWAKFISTMICGNLIAITLFLTIGLFAKNQIFAIGLVKLFLLIYFLVPFIEKILPSRIAWILWIFPNLWLYGMIENIFNEPERLKTAFGEAAGLFLISCSLANYLLYKKFKKKIMFN